MQGRDISLRRGNFSLNTAECKLRRSWKALIDHYERRDWLVKEKGIKGLGYKEASHFLRNIGFRAMRSSTSTF